MNSEELKRNLEILKYNPERHKNVDEALTDILNSEEYAPILKGVINNTKYIYEVKCIMATYNNIKDIPQNEIDTIYESKKVMLETEEKVGGNEVIFYLDNGDYHLAHKNSNSEYQDKLKFKCQDYIDVSDKCDSIICTKKNGGTIYNFNGDKIFSGFKEIDCVICQKLILIKGINGDKNKFGIIDMNGNVLKLSMNVDRDKRIYNFIHNLYLNYSRVIDVENIISLFNNLLNGVYPEYLYDMSYELIRVLNGKYVYCTHNNEKCYFELFGNKVISTEDYEYCDLPDNSEYNNSGIIVVCKYDVNFEKKYGLYDLDSQTEIVDCRFDYMYGWSYSATIAYNKIDGNTIPSLIIKDEYGKINIVDDVKKLIFLRRYNGDIKSLYYKYDCDGYNEVTIPRKIKKITESLYLVENYVYVDNMCSRPANYSLVRNLTSNPEVIFTVGQTLACRKSYIDGFVLSRDTYNKGYVTDYQGNTSELTVDFLLKNIQNIKIDENAYDDVPGWRVLEWLGDEKFTSFIKSIGCESNLSNSAFTLSSVKNKSIINKGNSQLSLYQKQEIISSVERNFKLVPVETKSNGPIKSLVDTTESKYKKSIIDTFVDYGQFVRVIINKEKLYEREEIYINKSNKSVISQKNFDVIDIYDKYMCIEAKYGNGKKQYLIEDNSPLIIGPFDKVVDYRDNIFIIQDKNRCQCYKDGVPITHAVDSIEFIPKKIILSDGTIEKSSYILKIENAGCLYVVDIDGDITLRKNNIVEDLERLMVENNEAKQKKLSKTLK